MLEASRVQSASDYLDLRGCTDSIVDATHQEAIKKKSWILCFEIGPATIKK